jgi:hypothetical protein
MAEVHNAGLTGLQLGQFLAANLYRKPYLTVMDVQLAERAVLSNAPLCLAPRLILSQLQGKRLKYTRIVAEPFISR